MLIKQEKSRKLRISLRLTHQM